MKNWHKYKITEKKIIIYLFLFSLLLISIAQFFIYDIISNNTSSNISSESSGNSGDTEKNVIVDNISRIKIKQDVSQWNELKELSIFNNYFFQNRAKIAPGIFGDYNFTVENESTSDFIYKINFIIDNPYKVNMRYKLKKNGEYILGNKKTWKKADLLSQEDLELKSLTTDLYTLEWKWIDTNYDTRIGEDKNSFYQMFIEVQAEQVITE